MTAAAKNTCSKATCKRIRNVSILESFFALFVLLLVLFGILQLYHFIVAHMVTEYATFRAARSSAVGFSDYLVRREAMVKAIPASGAIVRPFTPDDFGSASAQFSMEKRSIERFMEGIQYMEYEYWNGDIYRHKNYRCPDYGKPMYSCSCSICNEVASSETRLSVAQNVSGDTTTVQLAYNNYPLTMPLHELFSKDGGITIRKTVELTNHATIFLGE